jgi:NAD(P)-dependent dehydrogenase (short-subunit alcohol dehydrogenase family)
MKLDRKVAVITGAAAGIGEVSARLFAREGARLTLVDLDAGRLGTLADDLGKSSVVVETVAGDVARAEVASAIVDRTLSRFGRLDILFNVAGIVLGGTLVDCTEEDWQRSMDVNLKSMYLLARAAVPAMVRQGGGAIVNMASVAGPYGVANRGAYSVSKAGVVGLTKSLAIDFVKDGVRCNCICPATVDTPSLQQRIAQAEDPEEARRAFIARQPMGRIGRPEEIAALALYLASDDGRYMTGQAITIDGGMKL